MENNLTLESLQDVIRDQLKTYNNEGVELSNETKLNEVLSSSDGFSTPGSSMNMFKGNMRWIIWANKGKQVRFPSNWITFTVTELAEFIMTKQLE